MTIILVLDRNKNMQDAKSFYCKQGTEKD